MNGTIIKKSKINLFELAEKNLKLVKQFSQKKNISVDIDIDSSTYIYADYNMIDAIIRNLLSNAVKFTFENGSIRISSSINCKNVTVTVADNGRGIEEKNLENLFKLENSFSTSGTNGEKGTGIGLILSSDYIEKNKGEIWVESQLGVGSKFHVKLPLFNQVEKKIEC